MRNKLSGKRPYRGPDPGRGGVRFDMRVSETERERWAEAAALDGRSVSEFVREAANRAAASQIRLRQFGKRWVS